MIIIKISNQRSYYYIRIDDLKNIGFVWQELSKKSGISQADISRLERGNANPSLHTLQRLAAGMNMKLKLEFVKTASGS